jgi:hypothetical protein
MYAIINVPARRSRQVVYNEQKSTTVTDTMYLACTALVLFYCTWVSYIVLVRRSNRNAPVAQTLASLAQLRFLRCRESYENLRSEVVLKS